jgi:hypothetical protein
MRIEPPALCGRVNARVHGATPHAFVMVGAAAWPSATKTAPAMTRTAIRRYQHEIGADTTGYLTKEEVNRLSH